MIASLVSLVIASAVGFVVEWRAVTCFVTNGNARVAFAQLTSARLGPTCRRSRRASQFLGVGYALAISISAVVRLLAPGLPLPGPYALWVVAGFGVALLATILRACSIRALGELFDRDGLVRTRHLLVRNGPYRVVRHPAYAANVVFALAAGIMLVNWGSVCVATFVAVAAHVPRVRFEEALLTHRFPRAYREYAHGTGLVVPRRLR
jgi:protein-S-isoprenylcysteine O-methyltransferase Ste14